MNTQISRTFNYGRDNDLVQIAHRVVNHLTNNAAFPNPPVSIESAGLALDEYQTALSNAVGRDKAMVAIKNDKRAALRSVLMQLADYVSSEANGEKTKILQSGFQILRDREGGAIQPIHLLVVEIGPTGQAITRVGRIIGARTYIHEYTSDPLMTESSWKSKITTNRELVFSDLPSGVKHWFRVKAVGLGGHIEMSPVVSRFIQ